MTYNVVQYGDRLYPVGLAGYDTSDRLAVDPDSLESVVYSEHRPEYLLGTQLQSLRIIYGLQDFPRISPTVTELTINADKMREVSLAQLTGLTELNLTVCVASHLADIPQLTGLTILRITVPDKHRIYMNVNLASLTSLRVLILRGNIICTGDLPNSLTQITDLSGTSQVGSSTTARQCPQLATLVLDRFPLMPSNEMLKRMPYVEVRNCDSHTAGECVTHAVINGDGVDISTYDRIISLKTNNPDILRWVGTTLRDLTLTQDHAVGGLCPVGGLHSYKASKQPLYNTPLILSESADTLQSVKVTVHDIKYINSVAGDHAFSQLTRLVIKDRPKRFYGDYHAVALSADLPTLTKLRIDERITLANYGQYTGLTSLTFALPNDMTFSAFTRLRKLRILQSGGPISESLGSLTGLQSLTVGGRKCHLPRTLCRLQTTLDYVNIQCSVITAHRDLIPMLNMHGVLADCADAGYHSLGHAMEAATDGVCNVCCECADCFVRRCKTDGDSLLSLLPADVTRYMHGYIVTADEYCIANGKVTPVTQDAAPALPRLAPLLSAASAAADTEDDNTPEYYSDIDNVEDYHSDVASSMSPRHAADTDVGSDVNIGTDTDVGTDDTDVSFDTLPAYEVRTEEGLATVSIDTSDCNVTVGTYIEDDTTVVVVRMSVGDRITETVVRALDGNLTTCTRTK